MPVSSGRGSPWPGLQATEVACIGCATSDASLPDVDLLPCERRTGPFETKRRGSALKLHENEENREWHSHGLPKSQIAPDRHSGASGGCPKVSASTSGADGHHGMSECHLKSTSRYGGPSPGLGQAVKDLESSNGKLKKLGLSKPCAGGSTSEAAAAGKQSWFFAVTSEVFNSAGL